MPRLDKAGEYILCDEPRGGRRCGGRIAFSDQEGEGRVLRRLPGWDLGADGIFHEPPRDFVHRQLGHRARPLPKRITGTHNSGQSWLSPVLSNHVTRATTPSTSDAAIW